MATLGYNNNKNTINNMTYIDADSITSDEIYTNNLYINDILITPFSNTQILSNQIIQPESSSFSNQMNNIILNPNNNLIVNSGNITQYTTGNNIIGSCNMQSLVLNGNMTTNSNITQFSGSNTLSNANIGVVNMIIKESYDGNKKYIAANDKLLFAALTNEPLTKNNATIKSIYRNLLNLYIYIYNKK